MQVIIAEFDPKAYCSHLQDQADVYTDMGFRVLPLRGKHPTDKWKHLQDQPPRRVDIPYDATGIASLFGWEGLAATDFDVADEYLNWRSQNPETAARLPTMQTRRGFQVFHRTTRPVFRKTAYGEYRGSRKQYSALPPSLHPKGGVYRWLIPPPFSKSSVLEIPLVDPVAVGFLTVEDLKLPVHRRSRKEKVESISSTHPSTNYNSLSRRTYTTPVQRGIEHCRSFDVIPGPLDVEKIRLESQEFETPARGEKQQALHRACIYLQRRMRNKDNGCFFLSNEDAGRIVGGSKIWGRELLNKLLAKGLLIREDEVRHHQEKYGKRTKSGMQANWYSVPHCQ